MHAHKLAVIFGKGPSFDPTLIPFINAHTIIGINEAATAIRDFCPQPWLVFRDYAVAKVVRQYTWDNVYCPTRYRDDFPGATTFDYSDAWEGIPKDLGLSLNPHIPFSSSSAIWLAWCLGCTDVLINGIGDVGREYHDKFSGTPQTGGLQPLEEMQKIADVKGIRIHRLCPVK